MLVALTSFTEQTILQVCVHTKQADTAFFIRLNNTPHLPDRSAIHWAYYRRLCILAVLSKAAEKVGVRLSLRDPDVIVLGWLLGN